MADRYFINGGVDYNWSTTGNWSTTSGGAGGSAVPLATDAVFFDASSPNCTVNTSARVALSLTFTGYTNTITMSQQITVSGSITLVAAMTIAGAGALIAGATGTLTSNGKTWPNAMTIQGTMQTFSIVDAWVVSGLLTLGTSTQSITINSANAAHTITAQSGITIGGTGPTISGTTKIIVAGTGTITGSSSAGSLKNNLEFASGTITISGGFDYQGGTLTHTGGTVVTTGSTLVVGATTTFDCPNITWAAVQLVGASTITLTNKLVVGGLLTLGSTSSVLTVNGIIEASGGITTGTTAAISGTSALKLLLTQTVTRSQTGTFSKAIEINAPGGTITFSGNCEFALGLINVIDAAGIITDAGTWKAFGSGSSTKTSHPFFQTVIA